MTRSVPDRPGVSLADGRSALARPEPANLADVLERVLDKGIVIAGDIRVNLVDVELLTIRIRLLVASVDRAREMGIDWWEHDPMLSSRSDEDARRHRGRTPEGERQVAGPAGGRQPEEPGDQHGEERGEERGGDDDT